MLKVCFLREIMNNLPLQTTHSKLEATSAASSSPGNRAESLQVTLWYRIFFSPSTQRFKMLTRTIFQVLPIKSFPILKLSSMVGVSGDTTRVPQKWSESESESEIEIEIEIQRKRRMSDDEYLRWRPYWNLLKCWHFRKTGGSKSALHYDWAERHDQISPTHCLGMRAVGSILTLYATSTRNLNLNPTCSRKSQK